jgi:hypothetical protein
VVGVEDPVLGLDLVTAALFGIDVQRPGLLKHPAAVAIDQLRQPQRVTAGVELGLVVEPDRRSNLVGQVGGGGERCRQPQSPGCVDLVLNVAHPVGVLGVGQG